MLNIFYLVMFNLVWDIVVNIGRILDVDSFLGISKQIVEICFIWEFKEEIEICNCFLLCFLMFIVLLLKYFLNSLFNFLNFDVVIVFIFENFVVF